MQLARKKSVPESMSSEEKDQVVADESVIGGGSPSSPAIDSLYEQASIIQQKLATAASNPECENAYVQLIESSRSEVDQERQLASQLIFRFHRQFPSHAREAFEAVASLCGDKNTSIRRQALHDLPGMVVNVDLLDRSLDIVIPEFNSLDDVESKLVQKAILALMTVNQEQVLRRLFKEIPNYNVPILNFLKSKVVEAHAEEVPANQTLVLPLIRDSIHRVPSRDDQTFFDLFELMGRYPIMQTLVGRKELVDILSRHAGLPFEHQGDVAMVRKVLKCLTRGLKLFSKNVHSNKFADFVFQYGCPKVLDAKKRKDSGVTNAESIEIMRDLVDMTPTYDNAKEHLTQERQQLLFDIVNAYLIEPDELKESKQDNEEEDESKPSTSKTMQ
ncbi:hypothetical protein ACOME3_004844 [Neoechinorhynchus agilis]